MTSMIIDDLYEKLSFGPYAALFSGGDASGYVDEQAQGQVLSHANDGLLRLYTKFDLYQKTVLVEMDELTTYYHLSSKFAVSNDASTEIRRYIRDLPEEPFIDDVIRVLEIYNGFGYRQPLNDDGNPWSIFTPQKNTIQVPQPMPGQVLSVTYQAKHPKLVPGDGSQEIMLPDVLVEPLVSYIAYKKYTNMATPESTAKAQEHLAMFNSLCDEAVMNDAVNSSAATTNTRFEKRGFI